MGRTIVKKIRTDDERFIFDFKFVFKGDANQNCDSVFLTIYYLTPLPPQKMVTVFDSGKYGLNSVITFDVKEIKEEYQYYESCIYGQVSVMVRNENVWVIGDYHYGLFDREIHFEGAMLIIDLAKLPPGPPVPTPGPEPVAGPVKIGESKLTQASQGREQDLFPYIYMRRWPRITAADLENNFFLYQPYMSSPPAQNSLYNKLIKDTARTQKEKNAVDYINGDIKSRIGFLASVHELGGPIRHFLAFYKHIVDRFRNQPDTIEGCHEVIAVDDVIVEIYDILKLNGGLNNGEKLIMPGEVSEIDDDQEDIYSAEEDIPGPDIQNLLEAILNYLKSTEYLRQKERIWQSYFALVFIQGYDEQLLEDLIGILTTANFIEILVNDRNKNISLNKLYSLVNITIILPESFFTPPHANTSPPLSQSVPAAQSSSPPFSICEIIPYAIGQLQMVRQQFLKYEAGDVSHIENILQGEKKEIRRRKLNRTGESRENETYTDEMNENTTGNKQVDLSVETLRTISDNSGTNKVTTNYDNLKTTYGPPNIITYKGSWDAVEPGKKAVNMTKFARDILNKTVNRVNQKVKEVRSRSFLDETEETVTSTFDNSSSEGNSRGVYRWLNKVFSNYVVNYGNRLMIEFLVEAPAKNFLDTESRFSGLPSRPVSPREIEIKSYQDIQTDEKSYARYVAVCPEIKPPPQPRVVSAVIKGGEEKMIDIPSGYEAGSVNLTAIALPGHAPGVVEVILGKNAYHLTGGDTQTGNMNQEEESVPAAASWNYIAPLSPPAASEDMAVNIEITCKPTGFTLIEWKVKTFTIMEQNYHSQLNSYYKKVMPGQGERHSTAKRRLIQKEIMDACIELMFRRLIAFDPGKAGEITGVGDLRRIQFFEQMFEWDEMYYVFQERFKSGNTKKNLHLEIAEYNEFDRPFNLFIQADYARVLLPVSPEFNYIVLFFLATGMQWESQYLLVPSVGVYTEDKGKNRLAPTSGFDNTAHRNTAIFKDLKKIAFDNGLVEQVGTSWEITVPTAMKILQDDYDLFKREKE